MIRFRHIDECLWLEVNALAEDIDGRAFIHTYQYRIQNTAYRVMSIIGTLAMMRVVILVERAIGKAI